MTSERKRQPQIPVLPPGVTPEQIIADPRSFPPYNKIYKGLLDKNRLAEGDIPR